MFFRLTNSLATFQTMMNSIFSEEIAKQWLTVYMDDMAIHTKKRAGESELQHILHHRSYVSRVLAKLLKNNLFLKPEKCTFEQPSIEFLGVRVSEGTVHMDDVKVEKVRKWLPPHKRHRSQQVPRIHRLLSILHKRLLENSEAPITPYSQLNPLAMEQRTTTSL
jgi:Reverse transcriptase (RNA-dependent DNA polymerase)